MMMVVMMMMTQAVNSSLWQSVNPVQYLSPLNRLKIEFFNIYFICMNY